MTDDDFEEERYIGNRRFRELDDGRVVEVLSDGSVLENIEVEGKLISGYTTDLDDLHERIEGVRKESASESTARSKAEPGTREFEDVVARAMKKYGDSAMGGGGGIGTGSGMGSGSGMGRGSQVNGKSEDPLAKALNRKSETYSEHLQVVSSEFEKNQKGPVVSKSSAKNLMGGKKTRFLKRW